MRVWLLLALMCCNLACHANDRSQSRLAIIIDDIGYNQELGERAARLKGAFTLSVLPMTPYGYSIAQLAHSQGKELMLHLPMSNLNNIPLGKGGLSSGMNQDHFIQVVQQDLNSVPFIKGVNNHMGSSLTQEAQPMNWLMEVLKQRNLYFVDSRTTAATKAYDIARAHKLPSLKRDVFLDDTPTPEAIRYQLNRALTLAAQQGLAVAIGHPYSSTLAILDNIQPLLAQHKVTLVFASQLLKSEQPIMTNTNSVFVNHCPAPPDVFWYSASHHVALGDIVSFTLLNIFEAK